MEIKNYIIFYNLKKLLILVIISILSIKVAAEGCEMKIDYSQGMLSVNTDNFLKESSEGIDSEVAKFEIETIDRELILRKINAYKKSGRYEEAIRFLLNLEELKIGKREKSYVKLELANLLWFLHKYDECLYYLLDAAEDLKRFDDYELRIKLFQEFDQYYGQLGLYEKSLEWNSKAIQLLSKIPETTKREIKAREIYGARAYRFWRLDQEDSALYYAYRAKSHDESPNETLILLYYHLRNKTSQDSIEYYISKVKRDVDSSSNSLYHKFLGNIFIINYQIRTSELSLALPKIEEVIKIAEKIDKPRFLLAAYISMAKYQKAVDNELEELRYLAKLKEVQENLNEQKEIGLSLTIKTLERLNSESLIDINRKKNNILRIIVFFSILTGIYFYWISKKRQRKLLLLQKDIGLTKKEKVVLERIVESSIDKVAQMAKDNDPAFLALFKEFYYPIFNKLENLDPPLSTDEMKLCAMIYLDFCTKDIARITFVQVKTIQMKKYRLRKKFNIDSTVDLSDWIKKL